MGFPPFRRPWKQEIQEVQGTLEIASGKGAGIASSTILVLLWCSPPFRRPWKPEIQAIQGALEMASGKGVPQGFTYRNGKKSLPPPRPRSAHVRAKADHFSAQELRNRVAGFLNKAPHALWGMTAQLTQLLQSILMEASFVHAPKVVAKIGPRSCPSGRQSARGLGSWVWSLGHRSPTPTPYPACSTWTGSWQSRRGEKRARKQ